jgi:hypothetical protein
MTCLTGQRTSSISALADVPSRLKRTLINTALCVTRGNNSSISDARPHWDVRQGSLHGTVAQRVLGKVLLLPYPTVDAFA